MCNVFRMHIKSHRFMSQHRCVPRTLGRIVCFCMGRGFAFWGVLASSEIGHRGHGSTLHGPWLRLHLAHASSGCADRKQNVNGECCICIPEDDTKSGLLAAQLFLCWTSSFLTNRQARPYSNTQLTILCAYS